jgi:hypothetical protein
LAGVSNPRAPDGTEVDRHMVLLLDSWNAYRNKGVRARRGTSVGNFIVAYAFSANTHRIGHAVRLLMEAQIGAEALPLVRSM